MVCSSQTSHATQNSHNEGTMILTHAQLFLKNMPSQAKGKKVQSQSEESSKLNGKPANITLLELSCSDKLNFPGGIENAEAEEEDCDTPL